MNMQKSLHALARSVSLLSRRRRLLRRRRRFARTHVRKISDVPKASFRTKNQEQSDVKHQRDPKSTNHGDHDDGAELLEECYCTEEEDAGRGEGGERGGGYGEGHAGESFFRAIDSVMEASFGGGAISVSHVDDKIDG